MGSKLYTSVGGIISDGREVAILDDDKRYVDSVLYQPISFDEFALLRQAVRRFSVTDYFKEVVDCFVAGGGGVPAGFRIERRLEREGNLTFDLVRDIGYEENGRKRALPLIFSADTANPYEVADIKHMIGKLTCNPGIIYDLFLNNPAANVGNKFQTREEVISEIGRILGPGCDISVELNDPFEPSIDRILEEIAPFEEALSRHRLVVKVPHTGPVNSGNAGQLLEGTERLDRRFDQGSTADYLRGHNLALTLQKMGYRTNFTLMFEPHQVPLALQARPAYINAFVRHRLVASHRFSRDLAAYEASGDDAILVRLRDFMLAHDYLSSADEDAPLTRVLDIARTFLRQRRFDSPQGADGLDAARAGLRWLDMSNLDETRLIICSMEGDDNMPDILAMLCEDEFRHMSHRVVITSEPNYITRFSSSPQVVAYQRRFLKAVRTGERGAAR